MENEIADRMFAAIEKLIESKLIENEGGSAVYVAELRREAIEEFRACFRPPCYTDISLAELSTPAAPTSD